MRLWSLHPKYLDPQGLVALWREALLAQAVLAGRTRGYTRHPQLERFRDGASIANFLREVAKEAARRGYTFDRSKIDLPIRRSRVAVTIGQVRYEWDHLRQKLQRRSPQWLEVIGDIDLPELNDTFVLIDGEVEVWERR